MKITYGILGIDRCHIILFWHRTAVETVALQVGHAVRVGGCACAGCSVAKVMMLVIMTVNVCALTALMICCIASALAEPVRSVAVTMQAERSVDRIV